MFIVGHDVKQDEKKILLDEVVCDSVFNRYMYFQEEQSKIILLYYGMHMELIDITDVSITYLINLNFYNIYFHTLDNTK